MQSNREKVSYCIGLETGKNLRNQFKDIDPELLKKGFSDAIADRTPELADTEIKRILQALSEQVQQQQREFMMQIAEKNRQDGEDFLEENRNKPGVVTLPSGLQYKSIISGTGASPTLFDQVTIHYRGTFIDGRVFDSTYERNKPAQLPLSRTIPGWQEVLRLMKVGDKWHVAIPSYLAYGEAGYGPHIEPNMTLIFEIELIGIN